MDTSVLLALINLAGLMVIAFQTVILHWRQNNLITKQTAISDNVEKIEKATNSMKDALVASTAKASFAEGAASQQSPSARAQGFAAGEASRDLKP